MNNKKRGYTLEDVKLAVAESFSIAQVLRKLGLSPAGGNYEVLHRFLKINNISTEHFTGMLWSKGKIIGPKADLSNYLVECATGNITSNALRKRLISEGYFEHRCSNCNNTHWIGNPIPLELDHINGIHTDNRLENLRLLCPNCHALTDNYRGRNKKNN